MKSNTQFGTNIHWDLNGHKHSWFDFYPAQKENPGVDGKYYPVTHTLKPSSGMLVKGSSASKPMIYAAYNGGNDQRLKLTDLVAPTEDKDAARFADTHSVFKYYGIVKGDCDIPPGSFALFSNSGEDKCKDLILSRIDIYGNILTSPINSNNRNIKTKSTREYVRIIDPKGKRAGVDEVGKLLLEGFAHTVIVNDSECFKEGTASLTVNGKRGTYGKGGMVYQLDNKDGETWTTYWEGYNSFRVGQYYIIKTPNTK